MRVNFDPMLPIWAQVARQLESDMVSGRLKPGDKLPSTRDLALRFTINPNTAARVYQELESGGLCETRRGLGTYVTGDGGRLADLRTRLAEELITGFLSRIAELGLTPAEAAAMITAEAERKP
ncbi:MAG: GntR family transcriptional regulator [Clostridia bacterium]|nr:GntR family transcriptional regulator [Clostridia bacterium]